MTTRKLPYSLTKDGRASLRGEHLIPCLEMPRQNVLVGVKSGKKYERGYLVHVGKDVSAEDILNKLRVGEDEVAQARPVIDSFLVGLRSLKIGNVVSVSFPETDKCIVAKEADRPEIIEAKRRLP